MWNGACVAFGVAPLLTFGGVEALAAHGSEELKQRYLEKLVAGEWTATMNLTEPQAGSDLSAIRTRAEPCNDGSYRIYGQKIFISYGEHDLTDNIVHLVLARLPDAPKGTRGISLFLVPKVLPDGSRNDVRCSSLEHKLGIHASPTCTMIYGDGGGARGWLLGEKHRGLACMFTMMNSARLSVALQGVAVAERACQDAVAFAGERRQGASPSHNGNGMAPIIEHADVRRTLATMRVLTNAARAISYATAAAIDRSHRSQDSAERQAASDRAALLTPVAKAFATDIAVEVASLGIQVHGGMGFIEETGAASICRRQDSVDLRRHQRHSGDRSGDAETPPLRRRDGVFMDKPTRLVLAPWYLYVLPQPQKHSPSLLLGLQIPKSGRRLANSLHHLNRVSTNSLDRLVTRRGEVSPSLRFVEGLCLLRTIPFREPHALGWGRPL